MSRKIAFKPRDIVRCRRALLYTMNEDSFKASGTLVSMPLGSVVGEATNKEYESLVEETGGIYIVEVLSLPTYEVATSSMSEAEVQKVLRQYSNAEKLLEALDKNPGLLGTPEYREIPVINKDNEVGRCICLAAMDLIKVVLN